MYRDQLEAALARAEAAERIATEATATLQQLLTSNLVQLAHAAPEHIYVGIAGQVLALDAITGVVCWQCRLSSFDVVNVVRDGDVLLAGGRGELSRLEPQNGGVVWTNKLPGMGWGLPSLVLVPFGLAPQSTVFVGLKSRVIAIDCTTGELRWTRKLSTGVGSQTVHLAFCGGGLLATTAGEIHRVDPVSGESVWLNPLKGKGTGLASIGPVGTTAFDIQVAREVAQRAGGTGAG